LLFVFKILLIIVALQRLDQEEKQKYAVLFLLLLRLR
jgi:hypothetical protein